MTTYDRILSPLTIGPLTLPNRVVLAPMGTEMGLEDGRSTPREAAYYGARSRGGTGLVITGINFVQSDFEPISPGLARADTDEHTAGLKGIADAIHAGGGLAGLQLTPGLGRNNQYYDAMGMEPVSSSDNPYFFDPTRICRPLETHEIDLIVQRTGEAARRAYEAGFDVIDLHGHTGYLVDQFMSSVWNRRTDRYGGSAENRARFAVECIQAIKANAPGVVVSFRISVDHLFEGGRTWEETEGIVKALEAGGLDMILCDNGSYEAMDYVFPPYYLGDDCMVSAAKAVKSAVSIPVGACGNITPESGEEILARGEADLIVIGRGLIADPDIVTKLREGRPEDIRPCIRCNQLCTGNAFFGKAIGCAVNPEVGYEAERIITQTDSPKRITVIGAGPAGLEFARVAGLKGHTVDVYDRADRVGGVLLPAATPDFKRELFRMIEWWEHQLTQIDTVTIHLGREITPGDEALDGADVIVVAAGSHPFVPQSIIGAEHAVDVLAFHEGAEIGRRVVVCGGGLSGADAALELAEEGHEVTIVEMEEEIARDMLMLNRVSLQRELDRHGVTILTQTTVTEIVPEGVLADGPTGTQMIQADTVITAFGLRPATELGEALGAQVLTVGDCVQPRKVGDAVNDAYELAFTI
ncbi:FAD-binding protein [Flaviflexus salsibiostraticola]|uniref:FAD-binding protein n=1 Tax=Flaviflexus salsibiostraticola TaxID=1282737 RepID=A0A3S8ZBP4_9ACTO|nr:FAD-dependent oxidoreductase [Flaviflexus salsibiostraticola]AZN30902.1 FAD-binding protein [Flaviflexus salsibiostraticola]